MTISTYQQNHILIGNYKVIDDYIIENLKQNKSVSEIFNDVWLTVQDKWTTESETIIKIYRKSLRDHIYYIKKKNKL